METLPSVRHLTPQGDNVFSFDMQDGFYVLGIFPEFRDYLTVIVHGQVCSLAGLTLGRSLAPFHLCRLTETFVRRFRTADP
jgi:hypothetical protein